MPGANSYASPSTTGGNREDLADILSIIAPEATPVSSAIRKGSAPGATTFEWVVDTLRNPRTSGVPEGQDIQSFSNQAANRTRLSNKIHILTESYAVTDVEKLVDVAGAKGGDLYNEAKAKALTQLKRDMECIVCGAQDASAGDAATEWKTRGLWEWANPSSSNYAADFRSGTAATVTEAGFGTALAGLFTKYGEPKTFFGPMGTTVADTVDKFSQTMPVVEANPGTRPVGSNPGYVKGSTVTRVVTRYVTSFGTIDIIPDVFVNYSSGATGSATSGLLLNLDLLEMKTMEGLHSVDLEDMGGGPRGYAKCIFGVMCKNPSGILRVGS